MDGVELCRKILHIQDVVCEWIGLRLLLQYVVGVGFALRWLIMFCGSWHGYCCICIALAGVLPDRPGGFRERIPARMAGVWEGVV